MTWSDIDVLGPDFRALSLPHPADYDGEVVSTLVRYLPDDAPGDLGTRPALLYVHGYVDYFFHPHLARAAAEHGLDFYATDLRKCGRSWRPWQTPCYCRSLSEYYADLDAALAVIRADGQRPVVALGHSMGGLLVALWAADRGVDLAAIVLNSPWLELNASAFNRRVTTRLVHALARVAPRAPIGVRLAPHYGRMLHRDTGGAWDYDLAWKPHDGFPIRAGWLSAIRRGHRRVAGGLSIECPVLVATADRTGPHTRNHPLISRTDSVLDVADMIDLAPRIGSNVTITRVVDGVHDLALSEPAAREEYFAAVFAFLSPLGLTGRTSG